MPFASQPYKTGLCNRNCQPLLRCPDGSHISSTRRSCVWHGHSDQDGPADFSWSDNKYTAPAKKSLWGKDKPKSIYDLWKGKGLSDPKRDSSQVSPEGWLQSDAFKGDNPGWSYDKDGVPIPNANAPTPPPNPMATAPVATGGGYWNPYAVSRPYQAYGGGVKRRRSRSRSRRRVKRRATKSRSRSRSKTRSRSRSRSRRRH